MTTSIITNEDSYIEFHFDGEFTSGHKMTLLEVANVLSSTQTAITRSYLYEKHGNVTKHARTNNLERVESAFYVTTATISDGGVRIKLLGFGNLQKKILRNIGNVLEHSFLILQNANNTENINTVSTDYNALMQSLDDNRISPITYDTLVRDSLEDIERNYFHKSVSKEILTTLKPLITNQEGSLEIIISENNTRRYNFTPELASRYNNLVKSKSLGQPVIYEVEVKKLDLENKIAKGINVDGLGRPQIRFETPEQFDEIKRSFGIGQTMKFIGAPLLEYGSYDVRSGDIYFLKLDEDDQEDAG